MKTPYLLLLFLMIGAAPANAAGPDAKALLAKSKQAMGSLSFQGTVVFAKGDSLKAMRYQHALKGDVEQEYMSSLNSPELEVIRHEDDVYILNAGQNQYVASHQDYGDSFLMDIPDDLDALDKVYEFAALPAEDTVAGHKTTLISIKSKQNLRYTRHLWLDRDNFLPLKTVLYDLNNRPVLQGMFTEIDIKPAVPFAEFRFPKKPNGSKPLPVGEASFRLGEIPDGFKLVFFKTGDLHKTGEMVEYALLSDGFASVSIYAEKKPLDFNADTENSVDTVNSFSRVLGGYMLTVMGEVPMATVKLIAQGITLHPKPPQN